MICKNHEFNQNNILNHDTNPLMSHYSIASGTSMISVLIKIRSLAGASCILVHMILESLVDA